IIGDLAVFFQGNCQVTRHWNSPRKKHLIQSQPFLQVSRVNKNNSRDLTHDLILPALLFAALGGMVWAVRGCSGFGAMQGCIFAGVTWGTAWWFIARDPIGPQSRRYSSAWIILALAAGIGISGGRGWM